jgi:hypothetical protein
MGVTHTSADARPQVQKKVIALSLAFRPEMPKIEQSSGFNPSRAQ